MNVSLYVDILENIMKTQKFACVPAHFDQDCKRLVLWWFLAKGTHHVGVSDARLLQILQQKHNERKTF